MGNNQGGSETEEVSDEEITKIAKVGLDNFMQSFDDPPPENEAAVIQMFIDKQVARTCEKQIFQQITRLHKEIGKPIPFIVLFHSAFQMSIASVCGGTVPIMNIPDDCIPEEYREKFNSFLPPIKLGEEICLIIGFIRYDGKFVCKTTKWGYYDSDGSRKFGYSEIRHDAAS